MVVDPYAGSGTTAVSALVECRNFQGCDLELRYINIATQRLAALESGTLHIRDDIPVCAPTGRERVAIRPPHFAALIETPNA